MYKIDEDKAKTILVEELGYRPSSAETLLSTFPAEIHDELAEAIEIWLNDRTIADVSIRGLSIKEYMKIHHYNFLIAVRDLNRLLDDDLTEEQKDRLVEMLRIPQPEA